MLIKRSLSVGVILSLAVLLTAPTCRGAVEGGPSPIRFAILGDRTGGHVPGVYEDVIKEVARLRPDFVMTVGDMIEGYSEDTVQIRKEWEEYLSLVSPLSMPIHYTPGNHDITNAVMEPFYERFIGRPYHSFDVSGVHIVILDNSRSEYPAGLPAQQIEWLADDLRASSGARFTLVFYHKPFWYNGIASGKPDTLHSLFRDFGVDAVFGGHFHSYFSDTYDGIRYFTLGSSGGGADPGVTGVQFYFTWVTIDNDGISVAPIRKGSVLPPDEVLASEIRRIDQLALTGISFENAITIDENLSLRGSEAVVTITNPDTLSSVEDTLRWNVPAGWTVAPAQLPIRIAPDSNVTLTFTATRTGALYPAPTMKVRLPYGRGRTYQFEMPLRLSRQASCYPAGRAPTIDGRVTESVWKNPVNTLFAPDGGPMGVDSVYFYFAYDRSNLYLAAVCRESRPDSVAAKVKDRDGPVHAEDCVGYFLQPDPLKWDFYQIYFNPLGTAFDQMLSVTQDGQTNADLSWNGTYKVRTARGKDFWSLEARIPLKQFGVTAQSGSQWGLMDIRRKQKRLNAVADWQAPINYDPRTFGRLIFR